MTNDTESIPDDERERLIAEAKSMGFHYNGAEYVCRSELDSNELLNLLTGIPLPRRYGDDWPQRSEAARPAATQAAAGMTDERIYEIADSDECNPDNSGWGPKFSYLAFARAIERELRAGKGTDHE